ncbi:hypothetical protein H8E88_29530 [candidate division KSB1 bacterium]|nr:hypothetical protein [candidate division KSB1 bacterium]
MRTVIYKTENGIFEFNLPDVKDCLNRIIFEYDIEEASIILNFISSSSGKTITIPEKYDYFGFITLDLINNAKGSVMCKICKKIYQAGELNPNTIGHGKSPIDEEQLREIQELILKDLFRKKWIKAAIDNFKDLFRTKQPQPGMFGGKGFVCPQNHELIAMITWLT